MKGKIIDVDANSVETTLTVEYEGSKTFETTFDKRVFMARYSGFTHRYGVSPDSSLGTEVSVSPPCKMHNGKIDVLSN